MQQQLTNIKEAAETTCAGRTTRQQQPVDASVKQTAGTEVPFVWSSMPGKRIGTNQAKAGTSY